MKYLFFFLSAFIILFLITPMQIHLKYQNRKGIAVTVKGFGTLFAICFGIIGTVLHPSTHSYLILAGLIFGLLGDILLEYIVPLGGFAFFIGNVIYLSTMLMNQPIQKINFILFVIIFLFLLVSFLPKYPVFKAYLYGVIPYGVLVSLMAAIAIPFTLTQLHINDSYCLFGFGAFLFVVSDYLLAYRVLYEPKQWFEHISLGTYYIAQLCIGASLLLLQ